MPDFRKTHKGKTIDIDLIRMKQELELKEINKINVKREQDVDTKRRRSSNQDSKVSEMLANQELVRQKLQEQKRKKKEQEENVNNTDPYVEPVNFSETQIEEPKDRPEVTGRRIIKK